MELFTSFFGEMPHTPAWPTEMDASLKISSDITQCKENSKKRKEEKCYMIQPASDRLPLCANDTHVLCPQPTPNLGKEINCGCSGDVNMG